MVGCAATPVAIRVAIHTGFYDRPREYRKHSAPTPFLGGSAVLLAFLAASLLAGGLLARLLLIAVLGAGFWLIGTLDDRYAVAPKWRVLAEAAAAAALFAAHLGWSTKAGGPIDLVLTILWVVGLVNAFNLMDNLDGACATVGLVSATGVGTLALIKGHAHLAALAFALSGACLAFLRWNLSRPSRIFLGDGGSMPIGFLVAALAMATAHHARAGNAGLVVAALLAGLPILDVTLVSVSRIRRGVSILTGGRDHLTHRILRVLGNPRRVAASLALAQAALCAAAIGGFALGSAGVIAFGFSAFVAGIAAVLVLDSPAWRPGAPGSTDLRAEAREAAPVTLGSP